MKKSLLTITLATNAITKVSNDFFILIEFWVNEIKY